MCSRVTLRGGWTPKLLPRPECKWCWAVGLYSRAHKMSKSRGNVINPDDVITDYGADSLRLYEMFMGPLRETKVGAEPTPSPGVPIPVPP